MMGVMHLSLIGLIDFADLSLGMVMLHLFTFNPAWVPPWSAPAPDMLFYDGRCGLCHRAVRFVLAEDSTGVAFRFAPLGGDSFRAAVPDPGRARLPDSFVVFTAEGTVLTRAAAVRHVLRRLGGLWRVFGVLSHAVPVRVLDGVYDLIARTRHRLFAKPTDACPLLPRHLRERFAAC
jgi:predicted DCC family thiol-disulfide oxidoreductase YuxK